MSGEVVIVDQSPIGRTPRFEFPATYLKAFDAIRDVFCGKRPDAKTARLRPPVIFSFNVPGGRCENLPIGDGTVTVEMAVFLADVELHLRRVPGHALQERRSGSPLSREKCPRGICS